MNSLLNLIGLLTYTSGFYICIILIIFPELKADQISIGWIFGCLCLGTIAFIIRSEYLLDKIQKHEKEIDERLVKAIKEMLQ